jgi:fructose-1,6-bisphosphatase class II
VSSEVPTFEVLSRSFLKVAEEAAIAAARTMGQGKRKYSDHVAVEAMRSAMDKVPMRGTIVIGEGERDEAPMLYVGEPVGRRRADDVAVDIAVDPLEGTNLCATGSPGSIAVLAAATHGGLLHAPDCYMDKLVVGPAAKNHIDIDAPVKDNLRTIAKCLNRDVEDLVVIVLERERHQKLIEDIRAAGARIKLITDGDLSPAIAAAVRGTNVHAVMGIGGAPEGVLAAAALRCLGGGMRARLVVAKEGQLERLHKMGVTDLKKVYTEKELAPADDLLFVATGVTDGAFMRGVRFFGGGCRTSSLIMSLSERHIRFIDTVHVDPGSEVVVEF